jgi:predicted alpha-1,2-mannosidase
MKYNIKRAYLLTAFFIYGLNCFSQEIDYAAKVNTQIGNKGKGAKKEESYLEAGYTFPGAAYPFGMVQFTPTFFHPVKGFVVNQMSGAGCEHMGNFPTMPLVGKLKASPYDMMSLDPGFAIEQSTAGFFKVKAGSVDCNLTVTPRTGMALYQFPADAKQSTIVIGSGLNGTHLKDAFIKITGNNSCEGYADGGEFCGSPANYKLYFVAQFDVPFSDKGTWKGRQLQKGKDTVSGPISGAWFTFNTKKNKTIRYKFAISYVSLQNAKENLAAENADWNFEKLKANATAKWNGYLGRIAAKGGSDDHTTQFYTHLYHSFVHPNICSDVNGQYMGADGKVHTVNKGNYYTGFSNWDTYRTQVQLLALLAPEETSDMMNSVITFADQSGGGFPRWVLANTETGIMQGDPTTLLVANAYAFGATKFDTKKALEVMRRGAEVPGTKSQQTITRPYLQQYIDKGFINASMQLEYASADFAIAKFAQQTTGDKALYDAYLKRSQSWKNLYNPGTNWLQSRNEDGSWKKYNDDWREASYKNYFWMVPHNLTGLINIMGGKEAAEKRLDSFFTKINASYDQEWFAAGNEPDFQVPWIYNWVGKPAKTQQLVKRIIKEQYSNRPMGLPGNDDMGAMGAWYVLANIGLYPVVPAEAGFSINSPSFPEIDIRLPKGVLKITGGDENKAYIHSLQLNGKPYNSTWLPLAQIANGGILAFDLSDNNQQGWALNDSPPSFDNVAAAGKLPGWAFGPFIRPDNVNPIIAPDTNSVFSDPMSGKKLKWEANDVFNPAAMIKDNKIVVLYRAEDKSGEGIGGRTSRIGMAESTDGIVMQRNKQPVLFPAKDNQKEFEWNGGCEDPRVAVTEDGTYIILYTQWNKKVPRLAVATSKDLLHWKKYGPVFRKALNGKYFNMATKSASIITKLENGKQVIAKLNGKYMMYWGEAAVFAATSDDCINWTPVEEADGSLKKLIEPRKNHFDSQLTECGPPAVITDKGIVLLYNGKNLGDANGDKNYTPNSYCAGQVLFDLNDPLKPIARLDQPFFVPTAAFEKSGQYPAGTVFVEGLVFYNSKWFLYYGCADSRVAVAVFDPSIK